MGFCYGIRDTMRALEMSAVKTVMCWENLPDTRVVLKNSTTEEETVLYLKPGAEKDEKLFHDTETGVELEVIDTQPFVEWLATNYKKYGPELLFITDKSQGTPVCQRFWWCRWFPAVESGLLST